MFINNLEQQGFFEKSHNYHHKNTFDADDSEVSNKIDWTIKYLINYLLIDLTALVRKPMYAILNSFGFFPNFTKIQDTKIIKAAREILFVQSLYLITIYVLSNSIALLALHFVVPFTGTFFAKFLAEAQHSGLSKNKDLGALFHSRTLILPKPLAFLYSNMNYHVEHHFAPSVPYYNLPILHTILRDKGYLISNDGGLKRYCSYFWTDIINNKSQKKEQVNYE